ncbi:insulin-like growth factor-binding protein 3, partial [Pteropus vampyrus]|uniref:Insulin-like growth factor-binding protein 3 n=1 Tax=Pteropus vampyrus TaxID=132908 RepID=A0A6P3RUC2_PTEVA
RLRSCPAPLSLLPQPSGLALSPRPPRAPAGRRVGTPRRASCRRTRTALWDATMTALALLRGPPVARAGAGATGTGPVVRCEPCDARALAQCAPPPAAPACAELVREPGCSCCMTCALRAGQPCGVYTERCGAGLRCHPKPGEQRPLQALQDGRGVCANASAAGRLRAYPLPAPGDPTAPGASMSPLTMLDPGRRQAGLDQRK